MVTPPVEETLAEKSYVTVILRLVLSGDRHADCDLESGDVIDVDGMLRGRFTDWQGLLLAVRAYVSQSAQVESQTDLEQHDAREG